MIEFDVPGNPVAAARAKFSRQGGFVRTYSPRSNVEYAEWTLLAFRSQHPGFTPLDRGIPVVLDATFVFSRPKSHFGTGKNAQTLRTSAPVHHTQRPDIDNLLKLVKDALKGEAWHDDSQVCAYGRVEKRWAELGEQPHTRVCIRKIEGVANPSAP